MATKKTETLEIRPLKIQKAQFIIRGVSPLIVHAWSHKAKQEILDKETKNTGGKVKHVKKSPCADFMDCLYWLTEAPSVVTDHALDRDDLNEEAVIEEWKNAIESGARFGFPVNGIKQSIIMGAKRAGLDVVGTELKGSFFLSGATENSTTDIAEIITPEPPIMREDMVVVGGMSKAPDIRYRPEFKTWEIPLNIRYNATGKYTLEQILNCVNAGGFACGIGEWRPERDGQHGMYEIVTE